MSSGQLRIRGNLTATRRRATYTDLANGSSVSPAIAYTDQPTTGFFLNSTGLGITALGVEAFMARSSDGQLIADDAWGLGNVNAANVVGNLSAVTSVTVSNGSATLPSLTFSSALNTGVYYAGNNVLGLTANGASVMTLSNSQGVTVTGNLAASNVVAVGNVQGAYVLGNGSFLSSLPSPSFSGALVRYTISGQNGNKSLMSQAATVATVVYDTGISGTKYILTGTKHITVPVTGYYNVGGQVLVQNSGAVTSVRFTPDYTTSSTTTTVYGGWGIGSLADTDFVTYQTTNYFTAGQTFGMLVITTATNWQINECKMWIYKLG